MEVIDDMKMLLYKVKDVLKFISAILASNILKMNPKNKDIWIIMERKALIMPV